MNCTHIKMIEISEPTGNIECQDCVQSGDTWVHLRMCMTCGYIGCCDSSKNKHAGKHSLKNNHPIIRSIETGETWQYCYVHKEMINQ